MSVFLVSLILCSFIKCNLHLHCRDQNKGSELLTGFAVDHGRHVVGE